MMTFSMRWQKRSCTYSAPTACLLLILEVAVMGHQQAFGFDFYTMIPA